MKRNIVAQKSKVINIRELLEFIGPLPDEAVLMGMAQDKYPVLLDMMNRNTSNVMIWDMVAGQGLKILKVISEFLFKYHNNDVVDAEFLVITQSPTDWEGLNELGMGVNGKTSCIGVVPFHGELVEQLLEGMVRWIADFKGSKKPIIILVDGLERMNDLSVDAQRDFHRILTDGRKRNVYVISTALLKNGKDVEKWMGYIKYHAVGRPDNWFESREPNGSTLLFFTPETEI